MAMKKNVKTSRKSSGAASQEVGAGTTYHYGASKSGRKNLTPDPVADKGGAKGKKSSTY